MFKSYGDLSDAVSLLAHCPAERSFLLARDAHGGEPWLPSARCDHASWKATAQKLHLEVFGVESSGLAPLRVHKVWLPAHAPPSAFHAVYWVAVKVELRKASKAKANRCRLQWVTYAEIERLCAHAALRSPELLVFASLASGTEIPKDLDLGMDPGMLVEISEEQIVQGTDVGGGSVSLTSPQVALLHAAGYTREEQLSLYRALVTATFPALFVSARVLGQLLQDAGCPRAACAQLFRAADVSNRGGLSFHEAKLFCAAMEPATQHVGLPAELRCRYIFRYYGGGRSSKLEYAEFKELVSAARAARQLPIDSLSVARDADVCFKQLGLAPNSPLPLAEFLRGVATLLLRGTSSLLRAPRSIAGYLRDLQEKDTIPAKWKRTKDISAQSAAPTGAPAPAPAPADRAPRGDSAGSPGGAARPDYSSPGGAARPDYSSPGGAARPDYRVAPYTVQLRRAGPAPAYDVSSFDEGTVSASTARLLSAADGPGGPGGPGSRELLVPGAAPVEALAAVHYFASCLDEPAHQHQLHRGAGAGAGAGAGKAAWSWASRDEEAAMGALLYRLAEAVRPLCAAEPRLLRLEAPVYVIGDLHGNLAALLGMEAALWPAGAALAPARLLFLGDYVDRGPHGAELLAYLLAAKLQRPRAVRLVRGNHETRDVQRMFTFHTECVNKYGNIEGNKIWNAINNVFDVLPLAAVVDDKVFCCHGGIPPPWVCPLLAAIDQVPVPLPRPADQSTVAWELLWNDPVKPAKMTASLALELAANEGFAANARRGTGHVFDQAALARFLLANRLSHVVRAHELQPQGFMWQQRGRLVTVFSAARYCGGDNESGVVLLDAGKLLMIQLSGDYYPAP